MAAEAWPGCLHLEFWIAASLGEQKRETAHAAGSMRSASTPCSAAGRRGRPASLPRCGSDDELDENGGHKADIMGYE